MIKKKGSWTNKIVARLNWGAFNNASHETITVMNMHIATLSMYMSLVCMYLTQCHIPIT